MNGYWYDVGSSSFHTQPKFAELMPVFTFAENLQSITIAHYGGVQGMCGVWRASADGTRDCGQPDSSLCGGEEQDIVEEHYQSLQFLM